jgi:hypothetical protein
MEKDKDVALLKLITELFRDNFRTMKSMELVNFSGRTEKYMKESLENHNFMGMEK